MANRITVSICGEESFAVYAEGTKLLQYCSEKLDRVEKKMLVLNEEGKLDEF